MVLIIYDDCTIVNLEKLCSAYKHKVKALGSAYPRAFVVLIVTVSAVQPLANIVGNYTCYDREDKGNIKLESGPYIDEIEKKIDKCPGS